MAKWKSICLKSEVFFFSPRRRHRSRDRSNSWQAVSLKRGLADVCMPGWSFHLLYFYFPIVVQEEIT